MATITLEIDERTKKGKTFIEFLKQYVSDNTVEVVKQPNKATLKAMKEIDEGKTVKLTLAEFRELLK
jgi:hypothetical protein